ncbi:MAG: autotransporter-associated beta strand repeat-containing protein [Planctomycetaceae bacterium]
MVVTGSFTEATTIGSATLASAGESDAFILKLASDGSPTWTRSMGGSGWDAGRRIAVLPDGTAIVTGDFSGSASFGPLSLTSTNATDTFLTRVRGDGSLVISLFDGTRVIDVPATRVDTVGGSASLTLSGRQSIVDSIVGGTVRIAADGGTVNRLAGGRLLSAACVVVATSGSPAISVAGGAVAEFQLGTVGGPITGAGSIRKTGSGTLTLSGMNGYSGATLIDDGRLVVMGTTGLGTIDVGPDASIEGSGRIAGPLRLQSQATLRPGQRLGTLSTAAIEISGATIVEWELADAAGAAGSGWDFVSASGALTLTAADSHTPIVIRAVTLAGTSLQTPGPAVNFDPTRDHRWLLGTFSGGINGFTPGCMAVDTSGFANALNVTRAAFSVMRDGNNLYMNYTAGVSGITVPTGQTATDTEARTGVLQIVKQGGGTLILDKANSHSGGTIVEAGTLVVRNAAAFGTGAVIVKPGASIVIDAGAGTALLESLTIEAAGHVDIGTGSITVAKAMTFETLVGLIAAARGDGLWTEPSGLGSSAVARAVAQGVGRTIGWLDNGDGSFTIGFAAPGDSNLDLVVDVLDAANFLAGGKYDAAQATSWTEGDYNFDGILDILDTADFLGTGLFDAGAYGGAPSMPTAGSVASRDNAGSMISATDLAFAALAASQETTVTKKKRA